MNMNHLKASRNSKPTHPAKPALSLVPVEHPALSTISSEIPHGSDVSVLVEGMFALLRTKRNACGLAANQVGITQRIIVINTSDFVGAVINPVITNQTCTLRRSKEGCLSYPKLTAEIKRNHVVTLEGFDKDWNPIKKKCRGLTSFVAQHEIDHLNGQTIAMTRGGV